MIPGKELDALIGAKIMKVNPRILAGATKDKGESWAVIQNPIDGPFFTDADVRDWIESVKGYELMHLHYYPKYSRDISAAWGIVDKLAEENIFIRLSNVSGRGKWRACVCGILTEFTETPAMAICLAALKTVAP